jgi:hypothetical protein
MEGNCGQPTRGGVPPPDWGLGVGILFLTVKDRFVTKCETEPWTWTGSLRVVVKKAMNLRVP